MALDMTLGIHRSTVGYMRSKDTRWIDVEKDGVTVTIFLTQEQAIKLSEDILKGEFEGDDDE